MQFENRMDQNASQSGRSLTLHRGGDISFELYNMKINSIWRHGRERSLPGITYGRTKKERVFHNMKNEQVQSFLTK